MFEIVRYETYKEMSILFYGKYEVQLHCGKFRSSLNCSVLDENGKELEPCFADELVTRAEAIVKDIFEEIDLGYGFIGIESYDDPDKIEIYTRNSSYINSINNPYEEELIFHTAVIGINEAVIFASKR